MGRTGPLFGPVTIHLTWCSSKSDAEALSWPLIDPKVWVFRAFFFRLLKDFLWPAVRGLKSNCSESQSLLRITSNFLESQVTFWINGIVYGHYTCTAKGTSQNKKWLVKMRSHLSKWKVAFWRHSQNKMTSWRDMRNGKAYPIQPGLKQLSDLSALAIMLYVESWLCLCVVVRTTAGT